MSKVAILLALVVVVLLGAVDCAPQAANENEENKPTLAELIASLNNVSDEVPCAFVNGDPGICVPYYLCTDVGTVRGDGSCQLLNVCCRQKDVYQPSTETPPSDAEASSSTPEEKEQPAEEAVEN